MFRTFTTAAVLALTVATAQAGDVTTVHFGDLNLANASDAQILAGRVNTAAESACGSQFPVRDPSLFYKSMYEYCVLRVSQATSAKVLAMMGQARKIANK
jgi:UrcA family protein